MIKNEYHIDLNIVRVDTFDETIDYLKIINNNIENKNSL